MKRLEKESCFHYLNIKDTLLEVKSKLKYVPKPSPGLRHKHFQSQISSFHPQPLPDRTFQTSGEFLEHAGSWSKPETDEIRMSGCGAWASEYFKSSREILTWSQV